MEKRFAVQCTLLSLLSVSSAVLPVCAQTDDGALWTKLDVTKDGWLDGRELDWDGNGGTGSNWGRFDLNGDQMVTFDEWIAGRARERKTTIKPLGVFKPAAAIKNTPKASSKPRAKRATVVPAKPKVVAVKAAPVKITKVSPVTRRKGYIVGRAVKTNGSAVPSFTVHYSGFEDGKLASMFNGQIYETLDKEGKGSAGKYAVKVPPGAYRATAYTTYRYKGRVYNFDMELAPPTPKYDYLSSQLEKLRNGLVRNFILKMTEKKAGASEETETVYRYAYFGGTIDLDCSQQEGKFGIGKPLSTPLREAYPADSRILLNLVPTGPMVDGSPGKPVNANLRLGDDGKWTFLVRGIFPGTYRATAKLQLPDGSLKPLRLSTKRSDTVFPPGTSGEVIFKRYPAVTLDFLPNDLGPVPRMGVKVIDLYLGD